MARGYFHPGFSEANDRLAVSREDELGVRVLLGALIFLRCCLAD